MDALVSDVHTRAAVAGLRGLGRDGLDVLAVAPRATAAGMWSRFASGSAVAPDPVADPAGFPEEIARRVVERGPSVVNPVREEAIDALYRVALPAQVILP